MSGKQRRATLCEANAQYHKEERLRRLHDDKEKTKISRALESAFGTRKSGRSSGAGSNSNRLKS